MWQFQTVTPQMLQNTWLEVDYWLYAYRAKGVNIEGSLNGVQGAHYNFLDAIKCLWAFLYVLMNKYIFYQIYEVFCFVTTLRTPFSMTLYKNKTIIYDGMLHTSFVIPPQNLSPYEKKPWSNKAAFIYNHLPDHLRNDSINDPQDSTGQMAAG